MNFLNWYSGRHHGRHYGRRQGYHDPADWPRIVATWSLTPRPRSL